MLVERCRDQAPGVTSTARHHKAYSITGHVAYSAMRQGAAQQSAAGLAWQCEARSFTCSEGDEVVLYDGRPNGELLMATGSVQAKNPADYLTIEVCDCADQGTPCSCRQQQLHVSYIIISPTLIVWNHDPWQNAARVAR